jgi:hypothetical protein
MKTYMDLLVSNLREDAQQNRSVDMVAYLNWLTFDIIGDLSFASPFDALKSRQSHPWMSTFFKSIIEGTVLGQLLGFPILLPFLILFAGPLKSAQKRQLEYTRDKVQERIDGGSERPDFMAQVLKNNDFSDVHTGMTRGEIDVTFNLLMIAGSETTATLLSGCMYLLTQNENVTVKLKEEVRKAFSNSDEITVVKVSLRSGALILFWESLTLGTGQSITLSLSSHRRSTACLSSRTNRTISNHTARGCFHLRILGSRRRKDNRKKITKQYVLISNLGRCRHPSIGGQPLPCEFHTPG